MATRKQAMSLLPDGASIDSEPSYGEATLYSPKHKVWRTNGCSRFVVNYGYRGDMPFVWDEVIEAIKDGLDDGDPEDAWWIE